jgi:Zn-dependent protease with chaperone function
MPALILYSFKLSVCLGVIYLFYFLALRNLTFYNWNRWFLLIGSGLSFLIPLVQVPLVLKSQDSENLKMISVLPSLKNIYQPIIYAGNAPDAYLEYLSGFIPVLFGLGIFILGSKLLIQLVSLFRIRRSASLVQDGAIKIYQVNKQIAPFSFGNAIFLNKNLLSPAELQEVIRHELVHINQKHTLDVMWLEVLSLVNWYNPFVWLLKLAVRQNLEFIVDRAVLMAPGADKKYYQYLLLKVVGLPNLPITNSFNFSSLKTRIMMMNKKPSNRRELVKFLLVLPVMATLLLACRDNADTAFTDLSVAQDSKAAVPPPPPPAPAAPEIPPPPPPLMAEDQLPADQKLFLKEHPQVKYLYWKKGGYMLLILRSGQEEEYDLKTEEGRVMAEKKYGKLPKSPFSSDGTLIK